MEKLFVTVEEAAKALNTNPRHIKRMIIAGKLEAKNIGIGDRKFWRVLKTDLMRVQNGTL
jgi:excisionase family DNA binding protein